MRPQSPINIIKKHSLNWIASIALLLMGFGFLSARASDIKADTTIQWQKWSPEVFDQARREHKFILLNLEAVWCHWCHVMDKNTYSNPKVIKALKNNYIAVKVDHDANPGLANKYRDYGWPASIFLKSDGTEIVKRAGYIQPENMLRLLQAIVDDPSPELQTSFNFNNPESGQLTQQTRDQLIKQHLESFDPIEGSIKNAQKYIDPTSVEWDLEQALRGDKKALKRLTMTLDKATALLDPVWGGVYQYSTHSDWNHPHYEKIILTQSRNIDIYARAFALTHNKQYLHIANSIAEYLFNFLRADNHAFYNSQDADSPGPIKGSEYFALDDQQRKKNFIPKIDTHIYADSNGRIIQALAQLYMSTGDQQILEKALLAAEFILKEFKYEKTGFSHARSELQPKPYLSDNLYMAKAFLSLYEATADSTWLKRAMQSADYINSRFSFYPAGFAETMKDQTPIKPAVRIDSNIDLGRFANQLYHYSGKEEYQQMANQAMRYLAIPEVALSRITEAGILLLDDEMREDPPHLTVVGSKNDLKALDFYATIKKLPQTYKRIEWLDRNQGELINLDVNYPKLSSAATFFCADGRCSLPLKSTKALTQRIHEDFGFEVTVSKKK